MLYAQVPWGMFQGCEKHCGINPTSEYKNFGGVKWKFKTGGKIFSSPTVLNGIAYIGSEDKNLYAVDVNSGNLLWKFRTKGPIHSSPAVFKGVVYFGSFDGHYYALDAKSGEEKWKFKTGGEKWLGEKGYFGMQPASMYMEDPWQYFLSSPILDLNEKDLTLYFGSSDGNLYALDAKDGKLKWKFKTGNLVHSTPALYNGKVYVGSWDAYLYAVDANTGKEVWKFKTGEQPGMSGIQASPTIDNGKVYFGARDAYFYALDAETGSLAWKYFADNSWILTTAGAKDGVVYLGTSDSFLFLALDGNTGEEKFRVKTNGYIYSSPALVGNTAFIGDFTGQVFSIDLSSGKTTDVYSTESRKKNAKKVLNKEGNMDFMQLMLGKDNSLYSTTVWVMDQFYSLGSIVSSPIVRDAVVYFGSADGNFYAVNLRNEASSSGGHESHH